MTLIDESDANAAVMDAGSAEIRTGPMYPPYPPLEGEAALLPELLFVVVKPDAALVVGELTLLDAPSIIDVPRAGPVPVEPVSIDP